MLAPRTLLGSEPQLASIAIGSQRESGGFAAALQSFGVLWRSPSFRIANPLATLAPRTLLGSKRQITSMAIGSQRESGGFAAALQSFGVLGRSPSF